MYMSTYLYVCVCVCKYKCKCIYRGVFIILKQVLLVRSARKFFRHPREMSSHSQPPVIEKESLKDKEMRYHTAGVTDRPRLAVRI